MSDGLVQHSATSVPLRIRRYRSSDLGPVRDLFIRVNRELAPPAMRGVFEDYIALSLRDEIDRIPRYCSESRGGSFWVATQSDSLSGFFGLEKETASSVGIRRMYVELAKGRSSIAASMLRYAEDLSRAHGASKIVANTSELQAAAVMLYRSAGCTLTESGLAEPLTNKTVGHGIRRYRFEKQL
jgi:hypothetical protein